MGVRLLRSWLLVLVLVASIPCSPAQSNSAPSSGQKGSLASPITEVNGEYLGRLTNVKSDETVVFLGVRSLRGNFLALGIGDGGPIKDGEPVASCVDPGKPANCTICYLGKAGDESIIAVVTNRIPLRIGAGIWFNEGSRSGVPGVAVSEGVDLPQLERGKANLLGQLTVDDFGVTWGAEPDLGGWLRQLLAGSPSPLLKSARNLQPNKPTRLEKLRGGVTRMMTSRGDVLVFHK